MKSRKTVRLKGADYNRCQVVFLTVCTKDRRPILSRVVGTGVPDGPKIELTRYGQIADKYIRQISDFYDDLSVESYVIMPNHIHILLWVKGADRQGPRSLRTPVPTAEGDIVGADRQGPRSLRTPVPTAEGDIVGADRQGPRSLRTPVPTAEGVLKKIGATLTRSTCFLCFSFGYAVRKQPLRLLRKELIDLRNGLANEQLAALVTRVAASDERRVVASFLCALGRQVAEGAAG